MKKFLVLFVLALGFASFAKNSPVTESIVAKNSSLCGEDLVVLKDGDLKTSEYKIEVSYKQLACTATVTYNGHVEAVFSVPITDPAFTAMACQLASAQACGYIQDHGGTCP